MFSFCYISTALIPSLTYHLHLSHMLSLPNAGSMVESFSVYGRNQILDLNVNLKENQFYVIAKVVVYRNSLSNWRASLAEWFMFPVRMSRYQKSKLTIQKLVQIVGSNLTRSQSLFMLL